MNQKKLIILTSVITLVVFGLTAAALLYHQRAIKTLEDQLIKQKESYLKELAEKEEEISYLLTDSAKLQSSQEVPYSFQEFGIYSPLFNDKVIKEETYLYKRNLIKKMTITLSKETTNSNMPSEDDSNYLVESWEYPFLQVITDFDMVNYEKDPKTEVTSIESLRQSWKSETTFINSYKITFHRIPFTTTSPYLSSLESEIDFSPNGKPHFLRIRPAAYLYFTGTFSYDLQQSDFLRQVTKNIKEIGETISYIPY
ncbi:MAG: hypothetical protein M1514_01490 [Patescibacteria group bacterium]|nr:hypothetical protein [Patescibacteria group bacterium]